MRKDFEKARECFERGAETDPGYTRTAAHFKQGVLTYLGRTQYAMGRLAQAKQSLERALVLYGGDLLARLYLGMATVRLGDKAGGWRDIRESLQELHVWIESTVNSRAFEDYWDPNRQIRSKIQDALNLLGADGNQANLLDSIEEIAQEVEAETDRARQDESRDRQRW